MFRASYASWARACIGSFGLAIAAFSCSDQGDPTATGRDVVSKPAGDGREQAAPPAGGVRAWSAESQTAEELRRLGPDPFAPIPTDTVETEVAR